MQQGDYLIKLQMLEQQANQYGEQLQIINQQIDELNILKINLKKFEESKESEIFAEFGKGIFFKAKTESKELLVDVGAKTLVPKMPSDVVKIIDEQIEKFEEVKPQIASEIEKINLELDKLVNQAQMEKSNSKEDNEDEEDGEEKIVFKKK